MTSIRQTNFGAGELDPKLWGRTDLNKFEAGLRTMRNFFPSQHGAAVSRPGTQYIATLQVRPVAFSINEAFQLVPFVYSPTQSFLLVFSHQQVRFVQNGGWVLDTISGLPLSVASPYTRNDMGAIQHTQSGDIMTLAHPNYPPYELERLSNTDFTLTQMSFAVPTAYFTDTVSPFTLTLGPAVVASTIQSADAEHPVQEWHYKVTVLAQDQHTGRIFESLPADVTWKYNGTDFDGTAVPLQDFLPIYPDMAITLRRPTTAGLLPQPSGWEDARIIAFNYYRGRGDLYGFIGQTKTGSGISDRDFVDVGDAPNYEIQPPLGTNPFTVTDINGVAIRTENPTAIAYFQDRLAFGNTATRSDWIFGSAVSDYHNFDNTFLLLDSGALTFALASRQRTYIQSFLPLNRLLVFTSTSIWSIAGQDGSSLTFESVDAQMVEEIGANRLRPLSAEGAALYVRAKGRGVRAIVPVNVHSGYDGVDVSTTAQHLFLSNNIIDWTYQEDPWQLVWAVRDDGSLLSLTLDAKQGNWGWARHDSPSGGPDLTASALFMNVCAVPEGNEDAVYAVVQRYNGKFLERFVSRVALGTEADGKIALDASLHYSGAPTDTFSGFTHLAETFVYAVAAAQNDGGVVTQVVYGPLPVGHSGVVTLPEVPPGINGTLTLDIGLLFTPQLETLDVAQAPVRNNQKTVISVGVEVDQTKGLFAGQDLNHLSEYKQRTAADNYVGVSAANTLVRLNVSGRWSESGRAAIQQNAPLPVTVLGITREVEIGGK